MELALTLIIGILLLAYGLWACIGAIRYIRSGEYETDKRLREITQ